MTRVDRYVAAIFVRVFLICFLTVLGMYVVADFVTNLAELLRYGESHGGLLRVLIGFYMPQIPWFFDLTSRVLALVAAIFAVTWLQRNNEMAALMAAGISRWRIVKPIVAGALVIAVLAALNREVVIPRFGDALARDAKNFAGDQRETVQPRYDHATDIFFDAEGVLVGTKELVRPKFQLPTSLAERGTMIVAKRAQYKLAADRHPTGFLMLGVTQPENIERTRSISLRGRPVIYAPADTPWLKKDQLFVVTDLPFAHLQEGQTWQQFASTASLISGVRNPSLDYGADVSVAIHARFIQPVLDMTLLFQGLPIVLTRETKNAFVAVGSCTLMVAIFVVVTLASHGLGMNYLIRPSLAAWLPLIVFVPAAVLRGEPLRR